MHSNPNHEPIRSTVPKIYKTVPRNVEPMNGMQDLAIKEITLTGRAAHPSAGHDQLAVTPQRLQEFAPAAHAVLSLMIDK